MKYVTGFCAALWLLVWLTEPALASCTTQTITTPDGQVIICTTCCYGSQCNTTCF